MFKHFTAQNGVERVVRFGDSRNVSDDVQAALVPDSGLQTTSVPLPVVLGKVLGDILQMPAVFPMRPFARSGIQKPCPRRDLFQSLFQPRFAQCLIS